MATPQSFSSLPLPTLKLQVYTTTSGPQISFEHPCQPQALKGSRLLLPASLFLPSLVNSGNLTIPQNRPECGSHSPLPRPQPLSFLHPPPTPFVLPLGIPGGHYSHSCSSQKAGSRFRLLLFTPCVQTSPEQFPNSVFSIPTATIPMQTSCLRRLNSPLIWRFAKFFS